MQTMENQSFDIVVYGATSFVGKILARYLTDFVALNPEPALKWAIAGRSAAKLDQLKAELGQNELPTIIADASDSVALTQMCRQTKVVMTTVGPYALYGSTLLQCCAETGTDYCDLTGEVQWIHHMLEAHEASAKASGARIVNCCGFDSIPSDLGVYYTQQKFQEKFGKPASSVHMGMKAAKGGFSGGTYASLMNVMKEAANDPSLRKKMADPYLLCPGAKHKVHQHNPGLAEYDALSDYWTAPFIMAAINTRIVHRSNFLLEEQYGPNFRYQETFLVGKGLSGRAKATAMGAGLGGFMLTASLRPGRWVLGKILPEPGEGPSPEEQLAGFYDMRFYASDEQGNTLVGKVTGDRDPGYGSTSKMLAQSGLCLLQDVDREACPGGFWTPASGLGNTLQTRLEMHAGLTFSVVEE